MLIRLLLFASLLYGSHKLAAQNVASDTTQIEGDSVLINKNGKVITIESYAKRFNPRKALLYSAIIPGMGQVYNKKYWKLPLVYGGFAAMIAVIKSYQDQQVYYRNDLFSLISLKVTNPSLTKSPLGFSEQQLRNVVDKARRERDYFIILTGFLYILQMVDAHVDAHLKEFDLNPQLKVRLEPTIDQSVMTGRTTGISLKFRF